MTNAGNAVEKVFAHSIPASAYVDKAWEVDYILEIEEHPVDRVLPSSPPAS